MFNVHLAFIFCHLFPILSPFISILPKKTHPLSEKNQSLPISRKIITEFPLQVGSEDQCSMSIWGLVDVKGTLESRPYVVPQKSSFIYGCKSGSSFALYRRSRTLSDQTAFVLSLPVKSEKDTVHSKFYSVS